MNNESKYLPCSCCNINIDSYSEDMPLILVIAKLWNKYANRGKGFVPRFFGNLFRETLNKIIIRTKHGARLAIEPSSLEVYTHMLNHGNTWNEHVFDACKTSLGNEGVFYDIGANVGYMSIEMAKIFGEKVSVIAFEPQPLLAHAIALSSKLNKFENVKVFDLMLGETIGEANLYVGSHSIHASGVAREKNSTCIKRSVTTIDYMIEASLIPPPNVIKLDIEGGELAALSGARKTIISYRPHIIFESDENMERFGYTRNDVINLIKTMGIYDFFFISGTNCELIECANDNSSFAYSDILAKPI
ncbi:MAG: FkbM family methyltransferase [Proteobacteria bacterium]|nr:FkbM family methyltransferase [Pseudomonadota bacterium]